MLGNYFLALPTIKDTESQLSHTFSWWKETQFDSRKKFKTLTLSPWSLSCEHCHSCGQTPILRPLERPQPPTFESHCYFSSCQAFWQIFLPLCRFLTQINFAGFFHAYSIRITQFDFFKSSQLLLTALITIFPTGNVERIWWYLHLVFFGHKVAI